MTKALIVDARENGSFECGGIRSKIDGYQTSGRFSVVHHAIAPHALAAPMHYHHHQRGLRSHGV